MSHSYMRLSDVSPEDVEDGVAHARLRDGGIIDDQEIIDYIRKYSSTTNGYTEFYFSVLQDVFHHPSLKTNRLFVEHPVTGQFQVLESYNDLRDAQKRQEQAKVDADDKQLDAVHALVQLAPEEELALHTKLMSLPPKPTRPIREKAIEDTLQDSLDWQTVVMEYRNFAFVKRMIFFIFQGLLAGFCVVTVFFQKSVGDSKEQFFQYYQPFAQEIRRYLYLLTTLAVVGAFDHILTTWNHISTPNPLAEGLSSGFTIKLKDYQRTSLLFGAVLWLLYIICMLSSVIIAPFDVRVAIRNAHEGDDIASSLSWEERAANDNSFSSQYSQWSMLNSLRAATALLAWLLSCYVLWRDVSRYAKLWQYLRHVRETALLWMKRAKLLQGQEDLDDVPSAELCELITSQEFGLQRSRMALSLMLLEQQQQRTQQFGKAV